MANKKKKFEKRPELDRNNVAYYKTKVDSNVEYDKEVDRQVKIEPKEDKTQHEKPESWSQIAKRGLNQLEPMKTKNQTVRIKPSPLGVLDTIGLSSRRHTSTTNHSMDL